MEQRQTWELAGDARWLRVVKDPAGYLEIRLLSRTGQDLAVVTTTGGHLMVKIVEPTRKGPGIFTPRQRGV